MKPDFIDGVFDKPEHFTTQLPDEPYKDNHHILITFWSSNELKKIKEKCDYYIMSYVSHEVGCSKVFVSSDYGTLSVIDICVDCLYLKKGSGSLRLFFNLLPSLSRLSISPLTITLIKYENEKYDIYYQDRINKEDINKDRCRALFDKINEFANENELIYFESICGEIKNCREYYDKDNVINKEFLTITNLSSSKDITQKSKEVMEEIIKAGRTQFLTEYDCLLPYHEKDPLPIPIYLKKPEDMPEYNDLWKEIKDDDKDKYIPQGKVLGYYTRKEKGIEESPLIVLCPENIEKSSGPISVDNLYALVLVHELSHAILDRYYEYKLYNSIYENWNIEEIKVGQCWPYSLYSKAMEESLANMMALMWIMSYNNLPLFDQSLKFISNQQPAIYQFGISQYLANVDWKKWRNSPKNMKSLEEWFRTFFKDGNIIIQNDTVLPAFNAVFTAKEE